MDECPDPKLQALAVRLANGDYEIDPQFIAEAILRRAHELRRLWREASEGVFEPGQ
jgi:hypothetical protein